MCDYLDCDALIKSYTEANTRLQGRLDQQDILIAAQKKRILDLVNENHRKTDVMQIHLKNLQEANGKLCAAQQERMALLEVNKAHQEDNGRLRETNGRLLRTAVELRATVESLKAALEIARDLLSL